MTEPYFYTNNLDNNYYNFKLEQLKQHKINSYNINSLSVDGYIMPKLQRLYTYKSMPTNEEINYCCLRWMFHPHQF